MQEAGIWDLLDALRHRWILVSVLTGALVAGAAYKAESLPNIYEVEAVVAFSPRPGIDTDAVRVLLPKYVAYTTAPATVQRIAPTLGLEPKELESAVDATIATDTGNLAITSRLHDPAQAAEVANAFAEAAVGLSAGDELIVGETVAPAVVPDEPSGPPRRLLEAAAALVAIIISATIAFLLERRRPRLRSWRDISRATGTRVVGRIPRAPALKKGLRHGFSDPILASSFRTLRTNTERFMQEHAADTIMITSPSTGDGKTTVAALFAESLVRLGKTVLLVDGDLRRPGLSEASGLRGEVGLSEVLRDQVKLATAIRRGWIHGLSLLGAKIDPDAGDLLARRFGAVLAEARERFDVVVIDTPPLLGTDDSRTMATLTNGVLLVVASGSQLGPVNDAILALEAVKAPLLGVVSNRLRERSETYYGS